MIDSEYSHQRNNRFANDTMMSRTRMKKNRSGKNSKLINNLKTNFVYVLNCIGNNMKSLQKWNQTRDQDDKGNHWWYYDGALKITPRRNGSKNVAEQIASLSMIYFSCTLNGCTTAIRHQWNCKNKQCAKLNCKMTTKSTNIFQYKNCASLLLEFFRS